MTAGRRGGQSSLEIPGRARFGNGDNSIYAVHVSLDRVARMEHLAVDCSLALPELCATVARALLLPEMRLDFENDTEWGSCELEGIGYNVSRPYRRDTLHSWDPSVPDGCTVGIAISLGADHPHVDDDHWVNATLLASVVPRIAAALGCVVHHHRTWRRASD